MKLSPPTLDEYIGQARVKEHLRTIISSLEGKHVFDDPMDHTLLCGPPGFGKTSLVEIIAAELRSPLIKLMGPQLKTVNSLSFLKDILPWTFVFIDEIHALPIEVEEALYEPIDDIKWKGQSINKFTLIAATTKEGLVSKPLRSRFVINETLSPYTLDDLKTIVVSSATKLKLSIDDKAVEAIAKRSRGTPRVANQLIKRISYYSNRIDGVLAQKCFDSLRITEEGVDAQDYKILANVYKNSTGPIGIDALAAIVGEDKATIESREPFLVEAGLLQRTLKGRQLSLQGRKFVETYERYFND